MEGLFHTLYWIKIYTPRKTFTIARCVVAINRSGNSAPEIEGGQNGSVILFSEDISKVRVAYVVINV